MSSNSGKPGLSLRETIEEAVAAGCDQVGLTAAARGVGSIPRLGGFLIGFRILGAGDRRIARAIGVAKHGDAESPLVQFRQVRSMLGGKARPSLSEPVRMSCMLGLSPRTLMR